MVEAAIVEELIERPHGSGLGIVAAVEQPPHPRVHDRAGAHGAGLHRHVEIGVGQTPAPERARRTTQRKHLGVGGRIVAGLAFVMGERDHRTPHDDDGPYRDLSPCRRRLGRGECLAHEGQVLFGRGSRGGG